MNVKDITFLTPEIEIRFNHQTARDLNSPFSAMAKAFVTDFSSMILREKSLRQYPDIIALAYWMRASNIAKLESGFNLSNHQTVRVPRGNVLHFAPSNVDTIFVYSLFLSMLLGNRNIVRVSSKASPQQTVLIDIINRLLAIESFAGMRDSICLINYPHNAEITGYLSSHADTRVIWGGDETILTISSTPINPKANELKFANKFSMSLLDAAYLKRLDEKSFQQFVRDFVNDSYWFGQQGCSSPRSVIWINSHEHNLDIENFWRKVAESANEMFADSIEIADQMNREVSANLIAIEASSAVISRAGKMLTVVEVGCVNEHQSLRPHHSGAGLFLELKITELSELALLIDRKVQTVSYFGFDKTDIEELFVSAKVLPDRVVPVGKALEFSTNWDGYDLLDNLTRIIDFQ